MKLTWDVGQKLWWDGYYRDGDRSEFSPQRVSILANVESSLYDYEILVRFDCVKYVTESHLSY